MIVLTGRDGAGITAYGDGGLSGASLLSGSQLKSVKGTGYVQVTQEGATSVVVGTTTTLTSELGAKQPAISVSTANALPLLVGNVLASLGDSTTVLPKAEGDGAGGRRIYFQTVLGTSDIGGLQAALDLKAPCGEPELQRAEQY
jgi:hypothetical protein